MRIKLPLLILFFPTLLFSQFVPREILRGQLIADSIAVEKVTINNRSSNIYSISDDFGRFTIYAKPKDTITFSSIVFDSKSIVIEENDFAFETLKIKLEININTLDEVIISPIKLTGNLETDSKKIKTKTYIEKPDVDLKNTKITGVKTTENSAMNNVNKSLDGIDFISIGKNLYKAIFNPNKNPKKIAENRDFITFSEKIKTKFTYHFLTQTLKIKNDEIGLFLAFADTDEVQTKQLLRPENEIDLIEYLINKSEEFHKKK